MTKYTTIDTNFLLRYLLKDNIQQFEIVHDFFASLEISNKKAILTHGVIIETVYACIKLYNLEKEYVLHTLITLCEKSVFGGKEKGNIIQGLGFALNHNISFMDGYLLSLSKTTSTPLLTFDKKLLQLHTG